MALSGLMFFPLLYQVRNAFVPLPAQFFVGCAVMFLIVGFARASHFRERRRMRQTRPQAA
jgi:uncharacterized membrane protein